MTEDQFERQVACLLHGSYAFNLKMVCGGVAYFTAFTELVGFPKGSNRDIRQPSLVLPIPFQEDLHCLGQSYTLITNAGHYGYWLQRHGWALIARDFAREEMSQWLKARICLTDAHEVFTDVRLASPSARNRKTNRRRDELRKRDGNRCVVCGTEGTEGARLTLHHVVAFSSGGETTPRNLVTCCEDCNQSIGVGMNQAAFDQLGDYSLDLSLPKSEINERSMLAIKRLSANRMHSKCWV